MATVTVADNNNVTTAAIRRLEGAIATQTSQTTHRNVPGMMATLVIAWVVAIATIIPAIETIIETGIATVTILQLISAITAVAAAVEA